MYDRIVIPTDGSAGMSRVIRHGIQLAVVHDSVLHGIYVVNSARYAGFSMETSWEGITDMLRSEGEKALREFERHAEQRDIPVVTELRDGSPSAEIIDYTRHHGCDIIVMGTHGRGGINRLLLGSVAEQVVRTADVPVLTIRVSDVVEDDSSLEPGKRA